MRRLPLIHPRAAVAGLDRTAVWRLEAGQRRPGVDTLTRLAEALGVPAGELLG